MKYKTYSFFYKIGTRVALKNVGFKKKIPVSKLREGDVLESSRIWEGITKEQLKKIKDSRKRYVKIKDGVRFAPSFSLALIFTYFQGDAIFWLIKYFIWLTSLIKFLHYYGLGD